MVPASVDSKYRIVLCSLRDRILSGAYKPSARLPAWAQIGSEFGVGMATVQRAVDELGRDGFVEALPGAGTFVTPTPPHLCQYGLASHGKSHWSRLHMALHAAVGTFQATNTNIRFAEYATSTELGLHDDVDRLCEDVLRHRLGGLILSGIDVMADLAGTPALKEPGIPRVKGLLGPEPDIPVVYMDILTSFLSKAVEYLTSKGCRRIAHLRLISEPSCRKQFDEALGKTGIDIRPYWLQSVYAGGMQETVANVVLLLTQLEGDRRPDALIIHDDNLVEYAAAGLMAAGIRLPYDLDVVAHINYPSPAPNALPMKRLGFDCRAFLRKCIEVLEIQRRGEIPPMETVIPAVFEDELETGVTVSSEDAKQPSR